MFDYSRVDLTTEKNESNCCGTLRLNRTQLEMKFRVQIYVFGAFESLMRKLMFLFMLHFWGFNLSGNQYWGGELFIN